MLEGLDAIDWATLHGAYGPAGEVPDLIRALASSDGETAAKARSQLEGRISHQGTTYSASPPADRWLGHRDDRFLAATRAAITAVSTASAPT